MKRNTKASRVNFTDEAINELMEETYNEINDERNKAIKAYNEYKKLIKDTTDVAFVGKVTTDLLKIVDSTIEKKLKLIKLQSDYLLKVDKLNPANKEGISGGLSEEDKKAIDELVKANKLDLKSEKKYN